LSRSGTVAGGHPQIVPLRDVFQTSEFDDGGSLCFVYDYYPNASTLEQVYFAHAPKAAAVGFSGPPIGAHGKLSGGGASHAVAAAATLAAASSPAGAGYGASGGRHIPEDTLWTYITQLVS